MKIGIAGSFLFLAVALAGCTAQSDSNGLLGETSLSNTSNKVIPPLQSDNSSVDCSGWTQDATTYIRNQGLLTIDKTIYGVATFSCGAPDSELSTEYVEAFVFSNGVWAGAGIVPGPRLQFMTTQPCTSGEQVTCSALQIIGPDEEVPGTIVIFQEGSDLAWRFDPN